MAEHLIKKLLAFGMSDKEAKIYLALLELGAATVAETAKQSGVNRSSAYVVLEMLKKKGLAGTSDDKRVRHYVAASPETVLQLARSTARKQQNIKEDIESVLPELRALSKTTKHRPIVKVFEGEGIREVIYDVFKDNTTKDLKVYANAINMFKLFPQFLELNKERAAKGIRMYAINPATKELLEFVKKHRLPKNDKILLIPENKFKFPVNVGIYGDKISLISMMGDFGMIIENKEIAVTLRNSFDLAWEEASRLHRKYLTR